MTLEKLKVSFFKYHNLENRCRSECLKSLFILNSMMYVYNWTENCGQV